MKRIPKLIAEELDRAREWHLAKGSKHWKLVVNGRLAGIFPRTNDEASQRELLCMRAQIRRVMRETQGANQ